MGSLEGRKALVTGGASGIGLGTVRRLAAEGAAVAVVDQNDEAGKQVASEVGGTFVRCNVADPSEVAEAFRSAAAELGGLDISYMNAGVTTQRGEGPVDIANLSDEAYHRIVDINVNGVFYGVRESAKLMERGGAILATASLAGLISYAPDPIYALTKHAVVGLVRGVGPALEPKGITVNAICPGIVETPLVGAEAAKTIRDAGFPLLQPEDIAEAVVRAVTGGRTGECWVCQPGRDPEPYHFHGVPGPRVTGAEGRVPPGFERQL